MRHCRRDKDCPLWDELTRFQAAMAAGEVIWRRPPLHLPPGAPVTVNGQPRPTEPMKPWKAKKRAAKRG